MESKKPSGLGNDEAEPPEPLHEVSVANHQSTLAVDIEQLTAAVHAILRDSPYPSSSISLVIVDDPTIHDLNRQYLDHDYPTDVLSFPLEEDGDRLVGELIVSADTAISNASEYGWAAVNELLLYVVHGTLHLVGYRDKQPAEVTEMRRAEHKYLAELGIEVPASHLQAAEKSK